MTSWTAERWESIQSLFHEAAACVPTERAAFLDRVCEDDRLREDVERLLAADDVAGADLVELGVVGARRACDPLIGRRLGAFRVVEKLADGGMGSVYRAERIEGGFAQLAAIKLLRLCSASDSAQAWFVRERQTLARLTHPNIARILDGGETEDGRHYFAMEFIEGEPIDVHCAEQGLDRRGTLRLFVTVCQAVHHAHQNLVAHLDLKPGNILVDRGGHAKLVDFGVAGLLGEEAGRRPFTPGYASPELRDGEPASITADIYSLGVILGELLIGSRSDAEQTPIELLAKRLPSLDQDLVAIIARATAGDPALRYASCQEVADEIDRHLRGLPVVARGSDRLYRFGRFVARNRVAVGALALLVVVMALGLVFTLRSAQEARREMEHARIEATSSQVMASFLGDTFLSDDLVDHAAHRDDLRKVVLRRAEQVRRQYTASDHLRANLLDALGRVCTDLGLFADGEALLGEASTIRERTFGTRSLEHALSLTGIGRLRYAQGRFEDAEAVFAECLDIQESSPRSVHTDIAAAANDLAATERALGHLERALELHRRALEIRRADGGEDSVLAAESLNNLAGAEQDRTVAERDMREAVDIRERVLGHDDPLTIQSRINLARIVLSRNDLGAAESILVEATEAARRLGGLGAEVFGQSSMTLAFVDLRLGKSAEAEHVIEESIAVTRGRFGADHPRLASCLEIRAKVLEQKDDFAGATTDWREVLRIRRASLPADHRDVANSLCSLGAALDRKSVV